MGVRHLFASVAAWFGVPAERAQSETLPANFGAIVINGLFFPTAGKILGAGLVLTWFVSDLTPSAFAASLLIPLQYGLALVGQPWIAQWMSRQPVRARYYRNQALVRGVLWCALAATVFALGGKRSTAMLATFFLVVVGDAVAAGVGNIAFSDVLARVIPRSLRGRARGGRGMAGAIVAGAAGVALRFLVRPDSGLGVFAVLFAVAGVCYALGGVTIGLLQEPPPPRPHEKPIRERLAARIREMLARPTYRRFLALQVLLVPVTQALVFFSLFGRREFALDLKALGLLLVSDAIAPLVGNFAWGKWADRFGNPWVLRGVAVGSLVAPAMGIVLGVTGHQWAAGMVLAGFGVIVFALGFVTAGFELATKNYVLELAPDEDRRPVYIGTNDTLVAVPTMLLAAGGAAVDAWGFIPLFALIAACALAALALAFRLAPNRDAGRQSLRARARA